MDYVRERIRMRNGGTVNREKCKSCHNKLLNGILDSNRLKNRNHAMIVRIISSVISGVRDSTTLFLVFVIDDRHVNGASHQSKREQTSENNSDCHIHILLCKYQKNGVRSEMQQFDE